VARIGGYVTRALDDAVAVFPSDTRPLATSVIHEIQTEGLILRLKNRAFRKIVDLLREWVM